jgi:hypothetical protein
MDDFLMVMDHGPWTMDGAGQAPGGGPGARRRGY